MSDQEHSMLIEAGRATRFGPDSTLRICGCTAKQTRQPCRAPAMKNGRCRLHGGRSTGPRTEAGKAVIREATRKRLARAAITEDRR